MLEAKFESLAQANKANRLYQSGEEEWRRGRLRPAFRFFLASAKAGMVTAYCTVAQFYDQGEGVKANEIAALRWYQRAYRAGNYSAANNIGCIWRDRNELKRALLWFHRAVSLGDADANLNIAKIYLHHKGQLAKATRYLNATCKSAYATEGSKKEARLLLRGMKSKETKRARPSAHLRRLTRSHTAQ